MRARHNLGLRKIEYGRRPTNSHARFKRNPRLGPELKKKKRNKSASSQAGGPAPKESGSKLDWYHYDNRNNPDQNYDEDPEHFEKWKKESGFKQS